MSNPFDDFDTFAQVKSSTRVVTRTTTTKKPVQNKNVNSTGTKKKIVKKVIKKVAPKPQQDENYEIIEHYASTTQLPQAVKDACGDNEFLQAMIVGELINSPRFKNPYRRF